LNCSHTKNKTNVYGELMSIFKELISHLVKNNESQVDIYRVKSLLTLELNSNQQLVPVNKTNQVPKGIYVSSTVNYVKKRKTHGTKYCSSSV